MVQYILTPWRDRRELLKVRQQFYPAAAPSAPAAATTAPSTKTRMAASTTRAPATAAAPPRPSASSTHAADTTAATSTSANDHSAAAAAALAAQHHAVARVSMWMQRGNCPHMVESTALLTAAILSDGESSGSAGTYAVRAAYAAAFSRFVTGLLDGHQDKQRKLSMYSVAKTIGLPATFVELRHQATHEQLPSLAKLRSAARKALAWIWEYYWQHLGADEDEEVIVGDAAARGYREMVTAYLEEAEGARKAERKRLLGRLDESQLLTALSQVMEAPRDEVVLRGALRLSRELLHKGQEEVEEREDIDLQEQVEEIRTQISRSRDVLMSDARDEEKTAENAEHEGDESGGIGWAKHKGPWKPRPIGVA
ncbi:Pre-rRNA-processing protein las1 [Colletotrichum siamense]|uniref:Pre-rRNA-processing protein las1 n=1 Tax=Colletotrichum siamense TaxID=690259 RepID=A0A9P5K783_COLSI|nr:Pre-rRNA-processing protein las1 [Colletotrichum siamense]KAF4861624.1 Pre-rRNA-processing protein las1 [Colletotrichum siamense]